MTDKSHSGSKTLCCVAGKVIFAVPAEYPSELLINVSDFPELGTVCSGCCYGRNAVFHFQVDNSCTEFGHFCDFHDAYFLDITKKQEMDTICITEGS